MKKRTEFLGDLVSKMETNLKKTLPDITEKKYRFDEVLEMLVDIYGGSLGSSIPYQVKTKEGKVIAHIDQHSFKENFSIITKEMLMKSKVIKLEIVKDDQRSEINITIEKVEVKENAKLG